MRSHQKLPWLGCVVEQWTSYVNGQKHVRVTALFSVANGRNIVALCLLGDTLLIILYLLCNRHVKLFWSLVQLKNSVIYHCKHLGWHCRAISSATDEFFSFINPKLTIAKIIPPHSPY